MEKAKHILNKAGKLVQPVAMILVGVLVCTMILKEFLFSPEVLEALLKSNEADKREFATISAIALLVGAAMPYLLIKALDKTTAFMDRDKKEEGQ